MKKPNLIPSIFILLFALFSSRMSAQSLVLWHSDGSKTEIELFNQPLVQFVGDRVLVTSPVINLEYNKNDVVRFTYKDIDTKISTLEARKDIEQKDGQIIFHNVSSADKVAVYKADGVRVPVHLSFQGGNAVLSLSSLPSGVYLLNVNGRTSKFMKK